MKLRFRSHPVRGHEPQTRRGETTPKPKKDIRSPGFLLQGHSDSPNIGPNTSEHRWLFRLFIGTVTVAMSAAMIGCQRTRLDGLSFRNLDCGPNLQEVAKARSKTEDREISPVTLFFLAHPMDIVLEKTEPATNGSPRIRLSRDPDRKACFLKAFEKNTKALDAFLDELARAEILSTYPDANLLGSENAAEQTREFLSGQAWGSWAHVETEAGDMEERVSNYRKRNPTDSRERLEEGYDLAMEILDDLFNITWVPTKMMDGKGALPHATQSIFVVAPDALAAYGSTPGDFAAKYVNENLFHYGLEAIRHLGYDPVVIEPLSIPAATAQARIGLSDALRGEIFTRDTYLVAHDAQTNKEIVVFLEHTTFGGYETGKPSSEDSSRNYAREQGRIRELLNSQGIRSVTLQGSLEGGNFLLVKTPRGFRHIVSYRVGEGSEEAARKTAHLLQKELGVPSIIVPRGGRQATVHLDFDVARLELPNGNHVLVVDPDALTPNELQNLRKELGEEAVIMLESDENGSDPGGQLVPNIVQGVGYARDKVLLPYPDKEFEAQLNRLGFEPFTTGTKEYFQGLLTVGGGGPHCRLNPIPGLRLPAGQHQTPSGYRFSVGPSSINQFGPPEGN
jgi:hypothetical protein